MKSTLPLSASVLAVLLSIALPGVAASGNPKFPGSHADRTALAEAAALEAYAGCKPIPGAAEHQEKHPMPRTRGMQGMNPKLHTMDCSERDRARAGKPVTGRVGPPR